MREVSLGIAFEGKRLFAFGTITGLGSREEAEAILAAGVNLLVEGNAVLIQSAGRTLHRLDERNDDVGCWRVDADRACEEDYWTCCFSQREFRAGLSDDCNLRPTVWVISEFEIDEDGNRLAILDSNRGEFDKLVSDQRVLAEG